MQRIISPSIFFGTVALAIAIAAFAFFGAYTKAEAVRTSSIPNHQAGYSDNFTFFSATTTTATSTTDGSGGFTIAGAEQVNLLFSRGDTSGAGNSGSSKFYVQVTPDGSAWYYYNDLREVGSEISTSAFYDTRTGSTTIAAATSTKIYTMDSKGWLAIRCIVVETTDGEHTCKARAEF